MWYIVLIGYLFVTVLFSAAQPTLARVLIYLLFWSVLPTVFVFWVVHIRRRNRFARLAEKQQLQKHHEAHEAQD